MHALPLTEDHLRDLPPRTWRAWWRELPGYYRIGFRVAAILALLQLALAIRIAIGLIESPEIHHLRKLDIVVGYRLDFNYRLPQWFPANSAFVSQILNEGLTGRSCHNVDYVGAMGDLTDADVEFIARHFPNLEVFEASDVSATQFQSLERCSKITVLEIQRCDVEDAGLPNLSCFPRLWKLNLSETLVSDAIFLKLEQLPTFVRDFNACVSDVTYEGIHGSSKIGVFGGGPHPALSFLIGSIRWRDGQQSAGFRGPSAVVMKYDTAVETRSFARMYRGAMWWEGSWKHGDGEYDLSVKLGEYESAPVKVTVKERRPDVRRIEFLMPVTKAEALKSIGQ